MNTWYKGDGVYGDGPPFHWDYYNSFVIQPMLLNILATRSQSPLPRRNFFRPDDNGPGPTLRGNSGATDCS